MAKQITTYQADDGSIHESMFAATQHEKMLGFHKWCHDQFGEMLNREMIDTIFARFKSEYGISTKLKDQKGKTQVIG